MIRRGHEPYRWFLSWLVVLAFSVTTPAWAVDATGAPTPTSTSTAVLRDVTGAPLNTDTPTGTPGTPPASSTAPTRPTTTPVAPDTTRAPLASPTTTAPPTLQRNSGSLMGQAPPQASAPPPVPRENLLPEILVLATDMVQAAEQMRTLSSLGFQIRQRQRFNQMGWVLSRFQIPRGMEPEAAQTLLQTQFPDWLIEAEQRYQLNGEDPRQYGQRLSGLASANDCSAMPVTVAMLDSKVNADVLGSPANLIELDVTQQQTPPHRHGTSVATLFLGLGDVAPLLPAVNLIAINVFAADAREQIYSKTFWLVQGLDLALSQQPEPSVINFSLGGGHSAILAKAIEVAQQRAIIVAASGNGGADADPSYPAAYAAVVAVSAIDLRGRLHSDAQQGDYIDIAGPGVDIWTRDELGAGYYASGSSFAAPFVSAILALAAQQSPELTTDPTAVDDWLSHHAIDLGQPGKDPHFGWGRLSLPACKKN